ncbi:MAG: chorismate mutase [Parvibaculaceae bacterium]|jgi:isochorismate pyruvate lyase
MTHEPSRTTAALTDLRRQIDALDGELVALLARRQRCVERVIDIKREAKLPARVPERIDEVLARVRGLAETEKLEPDIAVALWREMIERFIAYEERALAG